MKVIKRDGTIVDYDRSKIVTAIEKANAEVSAADRIDRAHIDSIIDGIEALKRPPHAGGGHPGPGGAGPCG